MRRLWKSLALSLVMAAGARGQDAGAPLQSAVSIGRPVAQIGRPIALVPQPVAPALLDPLVQPIGFHGGDGPGTIARGSAPDSASAAIGRPLDNVNTTMFAWRSPQGDELAPRPQTAPPPIASSGPISSGPVASGPVIAGPIVSTDAGNCDGGVACGSAHRALFGMGCWNWPLFNHGQGACPMSDACDGGTCCDDCYPGNRFYAKAEYLFWQTRGSPTPPLVTQGNLNQGNLNQAALTPGTTVLFGGSDFSGGQRSGARLSAGYWFTDDHLLGVEGSFFFLGDKNGGFTAQSNGTGVNGNLPLGRPVTFVAQPATFPAANFGNLTGAARELVAGVQLLPDGVSTATLAGSVSVGTSSNFWGADANLRTNLCCGPNYFVDLIGGFRVLSLEEGLAINESLLVASTNPNNPAVNGSTIQVNDTFNTKNRFYGGQLGATGEWRRDRWSLGLDAKIGIGATEQTVDITGFTSTNQGGVVTTSANGLLTRVGPNGNTGRHTRDEFSIVPEIGLNLGYQLTTHVRCFVGYDFLYWTNVVRPGNQIDTFVDPNQVLSNPAGSPGANRPAFNFHNSDFWAQGVTVGLEFRW